MTVRTRIAPERTDTVAVPPARRRVVLVVAGVVLAGLAVALLPLLLLLVQRPDTAPAAEPASSASPTGESSTLPKLSYDPTALTTDLAAAAGAVTKPQLLFHSGDGERDGATAGLSACVADGASSRAAVFTLAHEGGAWVVTKRTWSAAQTC